MYAELLNALGDDGKDIVYYYGADVAGVDPPGEQINGRVSRVQKAAHDAVSGEVQVLSKGPSALLRPEVQCRA